MLTVIKGIKLGMTSVFDGSGTTLPVTLIRPYRMVVTGLKTPERDGYAAVQLAYQEATPKHIKRPLAGILARANVKGQYRKLFEAKVSAEDLNKYTVGQVIDPNEFLDYWGEVDVWGVSKGKGFAGAMKRWGFHGQQRTHGDPDNRRPQSGGATDPARVFKGSRRPGQMGNRRVTVRDLSCFEYHHAINVLVVQGSVPGPNGGEVTLKLRRALSDEEVEQIVAEREAMDGALQAKMQREREEAERKVREEAERKAKEEAEAAAAEETAPAVAEAEGEAPTDSGAAVEAGDAETPSDDQSVSEEVPEGAPPEDTEESEGSVADDKPEEVRE